MALSVKKKDTSPVTLKFLRTTIVAGEVVEAGKTKTVDGRSARLLIALNKAQPVKASGQAEKATAPNK